MEKTIQAKHLSDEQVLGVIRYRRENPDENGWTHTSPMHIAEALDVPFKVACAKIRSMDKRHVIEGCGCGCGSPMWELDQNGRAI